MNNTIIPKIKFKAMGVVRFEEEGLKRSESISSNLFDNNKISKIKRIKDNNFPFIHRKVKVDFPYEKLNFTTYPRPLKLHLQSFHDYF